MYKKMLSCIVLQLIVVSMALHSTQMVRAAKLENKITQESEFNPLQTTDQIKVNTTIPEVTSKIVLGFDIIQDQLELEDVAYIELSLTNEQLQAKGIELSFQLMQQVKDAEKDLIVRGDGYSVGLSSNDLMKVAEITTNLSVKADISLLKKDVYKNKAGAMISFPQTTILPCPVQLTVDVSNYSNLQPGKKVYVYRINEADNLLMSLVKNTATVAKDGTVSIGVVEGGTYVILPNVAKSSVKKTLIQQIQVIDEITMKQGKVADIKLQLPTVLQELSSFTKEELNAICSYKKGVTISCESSNIKVARVNKETRTVTGMKKGTATITVTVKFEDGKTKKYRTKVTVK